MTVMNYRELVGWQKAMDLAAECYRVTASFSRTEQFGLIAQIQRSAVAIPSNITEGQGRGTTREFLWHLGHANGSRCELETQLLLATRIGQLPDAESKKIMESCLEVARLLNGLINSLERKIAE